MSAYPALKTIIATLKNRAEAGDWEVAAQMATQVSASLSAGDFPAAQPADRAAIEESLAAIVALTERADPLREDMRRLLSAFGTPAAPV
ncbi:MAG: hypothetical protein LBS89_02905 [Zoogloeaceae bacterium]|jgi:hypothetical protein|nr:hypothetical protein [Zoogloeaceae bacterium]